MWWRRWWVWLALLVLSAIAVSVVYFWEDIRHWAYGEKASNGETLRSLVLAFAAVIGLTLATWRSFVLSVESVSVRDGFRARVRGVATREELVVSIPEGTLSAAQLADLQSGEWGKKPLHLQINTERSGTRVVKAPLISAGLSRGEGEAKQ